MTGIRTTRSSVTFRSPFTLKGFRQPEPPGTYQIEIDEDVIEGNDRTTYLRVATLLYIEAGGMIRTVTVDPADLQAALAQDAATPLPAD